MSRPRGDAVVALRFHQQAFEADATEGYQIDILQSPRHSWGGPFLPEGLDDSQIKAIRQLYRNYLERQRANPDFQKDDRSWHIFRVTGGQLFRTLPETVQACLHEAQVIAQEQEKALELRLVFDRSAQALLGLPWEMLYDPEAEFFFALRGAGITRQLWLPASQARARPAPKRILGVFAQPSDLSNLAQRAAYCPAPGCGEGFTWITGPDSLRQVEQALDSGDYDGLHITAHGQAGKSRTEFSLALEAEDGCARWLNPDQLAVFLANYPGLRFVYLDVCAGARVGGDGVEGSQEVETPSGSLPVSLLGLGIPTVIAMQETISQDAAGVAAQAFYQDLAQGAAPSQAMTTARRAVRLQLDDPLHWSVPVLYDDHKNRSQHSFATRTADELLNHVADIIQPRLGLALAIGLLSGALAHALAQLELVRLSDWHMLTSLVALSNLLVILGAAGMQAGQKELGEKYHLNVSGWLAVLLKKYASAGIWAGMGWMLIWLGWLSLCWIGVSEHLSAAGRQILWALALLGLACLGYVGARQAVRQERLFLRAGVGKPGAQDWLLFLAAPFFPLLYLTFLIPLWDLIISPVGLAALLILVAAGAAFAQSHK